jgi:hypothetical protein
MAPKTTMKKDSEKVATSTSRDSGAVGRNPVVYRELEKYLSLHADAQSKSILDFGSGKNAVHTKRLREQGLHVTAYDLPHNQQPGVHDPRALCSTYGIVVASNVLNTIPDRDDIDFAFYKMAQAVESFGTVILNYPAEPRKSEMTNEEFYNMVNHRFRVLASIGPRKGKGALVLVGTKR